MTRYVESSLSHLLHNFLLNPCLSSFLFNLKLLTFYSFIISYAIVRYNYVSSEVDLELWTLRANAQAGTAQWVHTFWVLCKNFTYNQVNLSIMTKAVAAPTLATSPLPSMLHLKEGGTLTTIDVRSSLSNRPIASSRDLYMAAETRWVIRRLRSMDLPRSWAQRVESVSNKNQTGKRIHTYPQKAIPKDKTNNIQNLDGSMIKYPIFLELKFCKSKL